MRPLCHSAIVQASPDDQSRATPRDDTFGPGHSFFSNIKQMPRTKTSRPKSGNAAAKSHSSPAPAPQIQAGRFTTKPAPAASVRIVVVDDHPLFRHGLVQLLNSEPSFAVCGEASSAPEAMTVVRREKPTMVIADLGLKGANGLELTKSLRAEFPCMKSSADELN
jgi:PleD family two-component response regulator